MPEASARGNSSSTTQPAASTQGGRPTSLYSSSYAPPARGATRDHEEDIKDEATAIRLAADLATKRMTGTSATSARLNSLSTGSMLPPSSSRQRIRDLLNKQRGGDEGEPPSGGPLSTSSSSSSTNKDPFQPNLGKMLWVYR